MNNDLNKKIIASTAGGRLPSIIDLVQDVLAYAYGQRASDVHIDPEEGSIRIRFRVDGVLKEIFNLPKNIHSEVISRIKILSSMRTDEHQVPQDGRFRCKLAEGKWVDIRVSVVPTYFGENAVMRLLTDSLAASTLENLDFTQVSQQKIFHAIKKPFGMVLATGPTGSGKTTTLYALVKALNNQAVSIITVEDPVEYAIAGVEQIQVNHRTNLNFAQGLRAVLRQDPDVIMVGEIRDSETARVATAAALTGHLLISSLHTTTPAAVLPRLLDMGIESYLVASTVNLVIGQRLVRRLCNDCQKEKIFSQAEINSLSQLLPASVLESGGGFFTASGCSGCGGSGFKGRLALHEVLEISSAVREAILHKASSEEIGRIAALEGSVPMIYDALKKARAGLTSLDEILKIIHE